VQKTQDKLTGMKLAEDPGLYKKKEKIVPEEVDEDAMYSEQPD
jgi:hypothetical protein